jgi:WXG100 family type VII secretion target
MAGSISVTPEQLTDISGQLNAGAGNVDEILSHLASVVSPLQTEWVGSAQMQFEALWQEWQTSATNLHAALAGIAQLTQNAAASYSSTEQSIASSFNQG